MHEPQRLSDIVRAVTGHDGPPRASTPRGRERQTRTKLTIKVLTQTLQALDELGGVDYLVDIGRKEPRAFLGMLKGVMSQQVDISDNSGLVGILEQRLNNAREIQARRIREVAALAAQAPRVLNGETRQVDTP